MQERVIMVILCNPDALDQLIAELTDWVKARWETEVIRWGITQKRRRGFLVICWDQGVPADFLMKIEGDSDMEQYLTYLEPVVSYD